MHLKKHLLSITAAGGLAIAGVAAVAPTHVLAGATPGSASNGCNTDQYLSAPVVTLVSSPIYLAVGAGISNALGGTGGNSNHVVVCYSDTPAGQNSNLAGGIVGVYVPIQTGNGETYCASDASTLVQVSCGVGVWPAATFTPAGVAGGTVSVAIPFGYCLGTSLTGPSNCPGPQPGAVIGATGLVLTSLGIGAAPTGTTTGASVSRAGTVYIDGIIQQGFAGADGVGVNLGTGFGPGVQECVLSCFTLPSAWAGIPAGPAPLGVISVAGTTLNLPNVLTAPACIGTPGATCPAPY